MAVNNYGNVYSEHTMKWDLDAICGSWTNINKNYKVCKTILIAIHTSCVKQFWYKAKNRSIGYTQTS